MTLEASKVAAEGLHISGAFESRGKGDDQYDNTHACIIRIHFTFSSFFNTSV